VFLSELNERPAAITVSNRKQPELMSAVYKAADMPAPVALAALCQRTKSLRDSLLPDGLRIIPRVEMVGSGGSALS
jgi:hypothetical protein